jgi:hypothetical protein
MGGLSSDVRIVLLLAQYPDSLLLKAKNFGQQKLKYGDLLISGGLLFSTLVASFVSKPAHISLLYGRRDSQRKSLGPQYLPRPRSTPLCFPSAYFSVRHHDRCSLDSVFLPASLARAKP